MRGVDLVDVVDGGPVGDRQSGRLAGRRRQLDEDRPGDGDETARRKDARRERDDPATEPVAGIARDLLDHSLSGEGREHPGRRRLREVDPLRDLGHADRPVGERGQDGEGSLDGLNSGHEAPVRLDLRPSFHHTAPCRIVEPRNDGHRAGQEHDVADEYEEIDLAALTDDELVEQMHNDLYDGMKEEIVQGTNILLERGFSATKVLDDALVAGMKIVGIDFRDGILFVPEVLLAANAMKAGMEILRPLLAETGAEPVGKVVIGTVKGDIHDIGKNLVGMMLEGAGFEVFDLGINTDAEKFIAALELHKPDILGMSALLTTTMPYMKVVIQTLKDRGMREDYIVLVGGAPLNEEFGLAVGADAYCRDAGVAAETARRLIDERRAAA